MGNIDISLPENDIGQLLDGIGVLIEQWEATEQFLVTGELREDVCIRESHSAHEAGAIAATYQAIQCRIREQLPQPN